MILMMNMRMKAKILLKKFSSVCLGPLISIKAQVEKHKDDESLRKWKEHLLGSLDIATVGEHLEPVLKMLNQTIKSENFMFCIFL
ncbi:unnamed protein product [Rhodiola kirilowii]